jgi:hypothetical protein
MEHWCLKIWMRLKKLIRAEEQEHMIPIYQTTVHMQIKQPIKPEDLLSETCAHFLIIAGISIPTWSL